MKSLVVSLGLAVIGLSLLLPVRAAGPGEQRCYRQQTGDTTEYFSWSFEPGGRLTTRDRRETFQLWLDPELATRRWSFEHPEQDTALSVDRQGDQLVWQGKLSGQPIERGDPIDAAPWYQALSVSLRNLLDHEDETLEFWLIRPDTLELHKLLATRRGWTRLERGGGTEEALQIRVTVPGIPAFIWHSDYWLARDGRFLRFVGKTSLLGDRPTVIELVESTDGCDILTDGWPEVGRHGF